MEIVASGFGKPEELLKAVPSDPGAPKKGEVAVEVRAIGVNHRDYKVYVDKSYTESHGGKLPDFPLNSGLRRRVSLRT